MYERFLNCKEEMHQDDLNEYVRWVSTHATVLEECRVHNCSHVPGSPYTQRYCCDYRYRRMGRVMEAKSWIRLGIARRNVSQG